MGAAVYRWFCSFRKITPGAPPRGDRTLHRYPARWRLRKLGPICPTGIVAPEKEEVEATLADWLNEFERVQLLLRLTRRPSWEISGLKSYP